MQDDAAAFHIFLLDNSPEPIAELAGSFEALGLKTSLIHKESNVGFGVGHNVLMQSAFEAGASHYVGLNPDGFLLPGALSYAISDSISRSDGALIEMDAFPVGHPKWWDPGDGTTAWVSGAAFVCPRGVFESTGGFDPNIHLYGEDVDWSLRCRAAGIPTVVSGQARFYHDITPRLGVADPERERSSLLGNWYLLEKWGAHERALEVKNRLMQLGVTDFPEVQAVESVPEGIANDLALSRYAHSRFWE